MLIGTDFAGLGQRNPLRAAVPLPRAQSPCSIPRENASRRVKIVVSYFFGRRERMHSPTLYSPRA